MYWNWSRRSPVRNGGAFFFLEQPDYQALMPLGATSEKLEIAPAKLARTVGGKPKGTHCNCVPSAVEALAVYS